MTDERGAAGWEAAIREHEAKLTVGARVRIALNGECDYKLHEHTGAGERDYENGAVGIIEEVVRPHDNPSHRFRVEFSPFVQSPQGARLFCSTYAPHELIPLEPDHPHGRAGEEA